MSIPWDNIEKKPTSQYKVDGQTLLDLRVARADCELQVVNVTKQLQNTKESLAEATKRIEAFEVTKGDYESTISELESAKALLEGTLTALKADNKTLETQLQAVTIKNNELLDKLGGMELIFTKIPDLESEVAGLKQDLADKVGALERANGKIAELERARETNEVTINALQSQPKEMRSPQGVEVAGAQGNATEMALLRTKITDLETRISDLTNQLENTTLASRVTMEAPTKSPAIKTAEPLSGVASARAVALARAAAMLEKHAGLDKKEGEAVKKDSP